MTISDLYDALSKNQTEKHIAIEKCRNGAEQEVEAILNEISLLQEKAAKIRTVALEKSFELAADYDATDRTLVAEILKAEAEEREHLYGDHINKNSNGVRVAHKGVMMRSDLASLPVLGKAAEQKLKKLNIVTFGDILSNKDKVVTLLNLSDKQWQSIVNAMQE
jgi:hypothetical protein